MEGGNETGVQQQAYIKSIQQHYNNTYLSSGGISSLELEQVT